MRTCPSCGKQFDWVRPPGSRGPAPRFCSVACRPSRQRRGGSGSRTTPETARRAAMARWEGVPPNERSRLASAAALARYSPEQVAAAAARKAELGARRSAPCPYCGTPVGRAGRKKCGSVECGRRYNADRMRATNSARRAQRLAQFIEEVDHLTVFERDNWTCGICKEPVDPMATFPDPLSASLDHVTPLSLGGEHSYANTRCAHFGCNSRRGNRAA